MYSCLFTSFLCNKVLKGHIMLKGVLVTNYCLPRYRAVGQRIIVANYVAGHSVAEHVPYPCQ